MAHDRHNICRRIEAEGRAAAELKAWAAKVNATAGQRIEAAEEAHSTLELRVRTLELKPRTPALATTPNLVPAASQGVPATGAETVPKTTMEFVGGATSSSAMSLDASKPPLSLQDRLAAAKQAAAAKQGSANQRLAAEENDEGSMMGESVDTINSKSTSDFQRYGHDDGSQTDHSSDNGGGDDDIKAKTDVGSSSGRIASASASTGKRGLAPVDGAATTQVPAQDSQANQSPSPNSTSSHSRRRHDPRSRYGMPQDFAIDDESESEQRAAETAGPTPSALSLLSDGGAPTPTPGGTNGGGGWTPAQTLQTNTTLSSDFTEQTLSSTAGAFAAKDTTGQSGEKQAADSDAAGSAAKGELQDAIAGPDQSPQHASHLTPTNKLAAAKGSPPGSLSAGTGRLSPPGSRGLGGGSLLAPLRGLSPGQATTVGGLAPIRLSPGSGGGLGGSPSSLGGSPGSKPVGESKEADDASETPSGAAEAKGGHGAEGLKEDVDASKAPAASLVHEDSGASFASDETGTTATATQQTNDEARRVRAIQHLSSPSTAPGAGLTPSARGWASDRVEAHIRDVLGMPDMARLFKEKRLDSKAVTHFEREDFTEPPPDGFGMAEDDPNLDRIWGFVEELQQFESRGGGGGGDGSGMGDGGKGESRGGNGEGGDRQAADTARSEKEIIEETVRKEGWTKHIAKNGKDYWAVIGKPEVSTWTQPRPGDLERKLRDLEAKNRAATG